MEIIGFDSEKNEIGSFSSIEFPALFPAEVPGLPKGSKSGTVPSIEGRNPTETLIVTGINGAHWWKGSTEAIKTMMENSGLFRCDIAVMNDSPNAVKPEDVDFPKYGLVVFNHVPNDWPEKAKDIEILATAFDAPDENRGHDGSDRHEPMLWTVKYGKGRVFVDAMGHAGDDLPGIYALECAGFQVTFLRGCEWTATGKVTQAVPDDMPKKREPSFRRDFRP